MARFTLYGLCLFLVLAAMAAASAMDDDPIAEAGGNIGRTAADDEALDDTPQALAEFGAITIPFEMPVDGVATIALYTPEGQLVRILGQLMRLEAGSYTLRWDGLDLFGNLVPAGTRLEMKAFTNRQVVARYQMAVAAPKVSPWGGRFPTTDGERLGGWLADHSTPGSVEAVGDRILIGASLAEHGQNLIAVDREGRKLWGGKLDGWLGPARLASQGDRVIALHGRRQALYRIDPENGEKRALTSDFAGRIRSLAIDGDTVFCFTEHRITSLDPFVPAFGNGAIDFANTQPQELNTTAPTEFTISPQTALGNTFTSPGNPRNGARPIYHRGEGFLIVDLKSPQTFGSVCLPALPNCGVIEVRVLAPGLEYDPSKHAPNRAKDDEIALDLFDDFWQVVGEAIPDEGLNYIWAGQGRVTTGAIQFRFLPKAGHGGKRRPGERLGNWLPRLPFARVMRERIAKVAVKPRVTAVGAVESFERRGAGGFAVTTRYPISKLIPLNILYDLGSEQTFDALAFLNCVNPKMHIEIWRGSGTPSGEEGEKGWQPALWYRGVRNKKLRWQTASTWGYERYAFLPERTTARWLRLRLVSGNLAGKWGQGAYRHNRPYLAESEEVAFVLTPDRPPVDDAPRHGLVLVDAESGAKRGRWLDDTYALEVVDSAPEGGLHSVIDGRLARLAIDPESGRLRPEPYGSARFDQAISIDVSADRIIVGDVGARQMVVCDRAGSELRRIGNGRPREVGPWDPLTVHSPSDVALAANGDIWMAEASWSPKRVARYSSDGRFLDELLGPPQYGGGGWLDPSLKAFHYRSMQWSIDLEAGTSQLARLPHRMYVPDRSAMHPAAINQGRSTFGYFHAGRPFRFQGRTYLVGSDHIILLRDDGTWHPCVVWGDAYENPFLMDKRSWQMHWAKVDLHGQSFLWCDENGDGDYQAEEVQLFATPRSSDPDREIPARWNSGWVPGPDFALWGHMIRVRPHAINEAGVPLFRHQDFQEWRSPAPLYTRGITYGGPKSAKPHYFAFKYVTEKGRLVQEGQPFVIESDGETVVGGPVTRAPSDYLPPIAGARMQVPMGIAGGGPSGSEAGELVFKYNRDGRVYIWAADHGVPIGQIFTGREGGWHGFPPQRGIEVTHRAFGWEGWFAHVVKGDDGHWYAQGGKGFHAISRLEGLDGFRLHRRTLVPSQAAQAHNKRLRPGLVAFHGPQIAVPTEDLAFAHADFRFKQVFRIDGNIDEWGERRLFQALGADDEGQGIDLTWTDQGVVIAIDGRGQISNSCHDWRQLHRCGFCIDIQFSSRLRPGSDSGVGPRRLVFGKVDGTWTGVCFDYADAGKGETVIYESPIGRIEVPSAWVLESGRDYRLEINEASLGVDILDLDSIGSGTDELLGEGFDPGDPASAGGSSRGQDQERPIWTAELLLPWSILGLQPNEKKGYAIDAEIGVIGANGSGDGSGEREYRFNKTPNPVVDPALDARIQPWTWQRLRFAHKVE